MSIKIFKEDKKIYLEYETIHINWFESQKNENELKIRKNKKDMFIFLYDEYIKDSYSNEIKDKNEEEIEPKIFRLILGELKENEYFLIEGRKLDIRQNIYIHKDVNINSKFFIGVNNLSIFKKIGDFLYSNNNNEDIYIGGKYKNTISEKSFLMMLKKLPNNYELKKYTENRHAITLSNYFDFSADIFDKYDKYMNKKDSVIDNNLNNVIVKKVELEKYELILTKLKEMLLNEDKYNEKQWQHEILDIILLLFPKYLYAFTEAPVKDFDTGTKRRIDIILIDYNGNVDIIEIKKPQGKSIMKEVQDRGNYLPQRELISAILQTEKYIYHLNKSGKAGENKLNKKYNKEIIKDFNIKIRNPQSIIIMGRECNMSDSQKKDFEIIKRKYKNVSDIITYDDLLNRLERFIKKWKSI